MEFFFGILRIFLCILFKGVNHNLDVLYVNILEKVDFREHPAESLKMKLGRRLGDF